MSLGVGTSFMCVFGLFLTLLFHPKYVICLKLKNTPREIRRAEYCARKIRKLVNDGIGRIRYALTVSEVHGHVVVGASYRPLKVGIRYLH